MKNKFTLLLVLLCVMPALQEVAAQTVGDYRTAANGDWNTLSSWERWNGAAWVTPASAPSSGDGVISIGHAIIISSAVTADQISVTSAGTLTVNSILTLDDGTGTDLDVSGTLVLANTIQNGTGTPQVSISNLLSWTGGTLGSQTTITPTGILNISGANKTLATTVNNNGTANWSASQIGFASGTFNNNGTFNGTGATSFNFGSGTNLFNNSATGIFNKSTSTGTITVNIPFENAGTTNLNAGTLLNTSVNGTFTNSGAINFASGTSLTLSGTLSGGNSLNTGTTFSGTGTFTITSPTNINFALTVPSTVTFTLSAVAGVIGGTGSLAVDGTWNWNSGTISLPTTVSSSATLTLAGSSTKAISGTTLTNNGTIAWTGFNLGFSNGTLTNNAAINITGNNTFSHSAGTNSFHNSSTGTITKSTTAGTTTLGVPVVNDGVIDIAIGQLTVSGTNASFTNNATINLNNTTLVSSGSLVAANSLNTGTTLLGSGTISFTTSAQINFALTIPATYTLSYSGNLQTLSGSGTLAVAGTMNWGLGSVSVPVTINSGATLNLQTGNKTLATTLTNNGTITWSLGDVAFNAGTLTNNGTMNVTGTGNVTSSGTPNFFINNGTFQKSLTSTGVTNLTTIDITNAGTMDLLAGTVTKTGVTTVGFHNTGTINVASGATFIYGSGGASGLLTLDPGTVVSGGGTFRINANTASNLALTFPSTMAVEIGIGAAPPVTGTGSLTVDGTLLWGGGTMSVPLTIGATGTMTSTAAKTITAAFVNDGVVNLTDPATGNITLNNTSFTNNGTINDNFAVAARSFASAGGTNSFINNGVYTKTNNAFSTTFVAAVPVTNNASGRFEGIGSIVFGASPATNSGTIAPGGTTTTGILAVTANAVTSHTPTIAINIVDGSGAGTGHDRLDMSAVTNLSTSTLTVTEVASAPATSYIIMTAPGTNGFTGTFSSVTLPPTYSLTIDNAVNPSLVILTKTGTLPLSWGSFSVTKQGNTALLKWSTFQEENTSHFEVEHSTDGRNFSPVGNVNAGGHTSNEVFYSFVHTSPSLVSTNFYRIKQVDLNGASTLSRVVVLDLGTGSAAAIKATPNPFRDNLQIIVKHEDMSVTLFNSNGIILRSWKLQPGLQTLPAGDLPKGIYYLNFYQKDKRIGTQQVIKL